MQRERSVVGGNGLLAASAMVNFESLKHAKGVKLQNFNEITDYSVQTPNIGFLCQGRE